MPSGALGALVDEAVGAGGEGRAAVGAAGAVDAPGVASIERSTAVIASDDVPNGNVARRCPVPSTRKTSAVCDIE